MSEFLTPSGLAERLVEKTGVSPETAKNFANVFFSIVKNQLKKSDFFSIYNFGTFRKTWIETTWGLNPSTGEKIEIPAHYRIKFTPCASVARRINKRYAVLKPKILPDDEEVYATSSIPAAMPVEDQKINEEESLLRKAEKLKALSEEDKTAVIETESNETETVQDKTLEQMDDNAQDEKEAKRKKPVKLFVIIGLVIALIAILIAVLLNCCNGNKVKKASEPVSSKKKVEEKIPEPVTEPEPEVEKESEPEPELQEEVAAELMFEEFTVPYGSSYHQIAEEKFHNAHLWPYLYSLNKNIAPDPDLIVASHNINIPSAPDLQKDKDVVCQSVLDAYNGYLLMCEKEPDSKRNDERRRLASRVLVSGEILYPGFIKEYSSRILPEYAELAQNIADHQFR